MNDNDLSSNAEGVTMASTDSNQTIFVGKEAEATAQLTLALANRHGLVTGATGTGKTVSLQVLAEGFASAGVPVFAADIKGDLSGISALGEAKDFILKRAADMDLNISRTSFRPSSGMFSAKAVIRCGRPSQKWARCCCRG